MSAKLPGMHFEGPSAPSRARLKLWAVRIAAGLGLSYLAYVLIFLVLLNASGLALLSALFRDVHMETQSGYSLVPGVLVVRGAKFELVDYDIELRVEAKEARLDFAPLDLIRQTLTVEELEAQGAKFHLLHRVRATPRQEKRARYFPRISTRSPIYDGERPPYEPPPLAVVIEKIEATLVEVWISEYRSEGSIQASGSLTLDDRFLIDQAQVTLQDTSVFVGDRQPISGSSCILGANVGPFEVHNANAHDILRSIKGTGRCEATLEDISIFDLYLLDRPISARGRGFTQLDVRIEEGRLISSSAETRLDQFDLKLHDTVLSGPARADLEVDELGRAKLEILQEPAREGRKRGFEKVVLELHAEHEVLSQPALRRLHLKLDGLTFRDPLLMRLLTKREGLPKMDSRNTTLSLDVHMNKQDSSAVEWDVATEGSSSLYFDEGKTLHCAHDVDLHCDSSSGKTKCTSSKLACKEGKLSLPQANDLEFWVVANEATLQIDENSNFECRFEITGSNPKQTLHDLIRPAPLRQLGISLLPLGKMSAKLEVSRSVGPGEEGVISGTVNDLRTGIVRGAGTFKLTEEFSSRWLVKTGPARMGIEQTSAGVKVIPFVSSRWLDEQ